MKILILHPNFPAQFKHLAKSFSDNGHDVLFLCQTHYGRSIPGVKKLTLKNAAGHKALNELKLSLFDRSQKLAWQYREGFQTLKSQGWKPDLVISHTGWGCGLHAKEVWPKTRLISYLEWWFDPESSFFHYNDNDKNLRLKNSIAKCWLRNQQISLELASSDEIVSPTFWQKNQLPATFRKKCNIIFDGIDLDIYKSRPDVIREKVITYGTRGMDPIRCFPQFIMAICEVLIKCEDYTVEIAGLDETFYGLPPKKTTWGKWAKSYINDKKLQSRIRWVGKLPPGKYELWLNKSCCHVYLTHPFVASWSLVEAYCSGTPLVISDVETALEICQPNFGVDTTNHINPNNITQSIIRSLRSNNYDSTTLSQLRQPSRFGIRSALEQWGVVAGVELTTTD